MKLSALALALLLLLGLCSCGNPIRDIVTQPETVPSGEPDLPDEPDSTPVPTPETEEECRARLTKKMQDIFGAAEPMENSSFALG